MSYTFSFILEMSPGLRAWHSNVLAGGRGRLVADAHSVPLLWGVGGNEGSCRRMAPLVTLFFFFYLLLAS